METTKKIYIGGGEDGIKRLENIKKLAGKYFDGNVSALFNDALDRIYGLDRFTGDPKDPTKMDENFLLNDSAKRLTRGRRRRTMRPKDH